MKPEKLRAILERYPRFPLACYPTPIEEMPRLSQKYQRRMWIKREDTLGPGLGGNKVRKLEFLIAEAQAQNHRKVVTFGGLQSNHARLTAAAANRAGMECHLFFFEKRPKQLLGNLVIDRVLGAKMHFVPLGGGGGMSLETSIRLVQWLSRLWVGRNFFIPVGGHHWLGCLGYVAAAVEIYQQTQERNLENVVVILAAGSGGTLAGLLAGFHLLEAPVQLLGIDVGKLWKGFPASIARLASEICYRLGEPYTFESKDVPLIEERFVGEGYAIPSQAGLYALRTAAELEGLLLDPIYTAKAFAGMLTLIAENELDKEQTLLFLHTGGLPGIFAYPWESWNK